MPRRPFSSLIVLVIVLVVAFLRSTTVEFEYSHWERILPETQAVILEAIGQEPLVLGAEFSQIGPDVFLGMLASHPIDRERAKRLVDNGIRLVEEETTKGMYWLVVRVYYVNEVMQDGKPLLEEEIVAEGRKGRSSENIKWSGEYH